MVQYPPTVDLVFAALADPTRRAVLERLGAGSATISELAEPFTGRGLGFWPSLIAIAIVGR